MSYSNCLGCGVFLASSISECPICGYDNSFGQYYDIHIDDEFLNEFNDTFKPEDEPDH
ncbi:MAG: hypothetical protein ABIJ59_02080 [Pseudomonadota bacterium]